MPTLGFADYQPKDDAAELIDQVRGVLDEYRAYLPMTIRQIFYRLVGAHGYSKTEKAYKRLASVMVRARRARMIPFESIRDDGVTVEEPWHYSGPEAVRDSLGNISTGYRRDRQEGQEYRLIVGCEAAGMVPQMLRVCKPYGIAVRSSGGFDSVTAKHDLAMQVYHSGQYTILLHVGDHDPSGVHVYQNLESDVFEFLIGNIVREGENGSPNFEIIRVAITPEQVFDHGLDTAPAKATDNRSFEGIGDDPTATAQAEALPPDLLASELQGWIDYYMDADILATVMDCEASERDLIAERLDRVSFRRPGRPTAIDDDAKARIAEMRSAGCSVREIATELGVSKSAVGRAFQRA